MCKNFLLSSVSSDIIQSFRVGIGIFMKENLELGVQANIQKELPPNEQRINELLGNESIKNELLQTRHIATFARRTQLKADLETSGEVFKETPDFKFIAEFQTALYDHAKKTVHLDAWNISHSEVARKRDLLTRDEWGHQVAETGNYTGADIFVLREAKDIKIMIIDSLFGFSIEELSVIRKLGYSVLGPNWNWLIVEPKEKNIVSIPSALSKHADFI